MGLQYRANGQMTRVRKDDNIPQRLSLQGNPSEKTDFFNEAKTNEVYDFIRLARTCGGIKVSRTLTTTSLRLSRRRLTLLVVKLPEQFPIVLLHWMQIGIAGNDGIAELPIRFFFHKFCSCRICQNVETHAGKRALLPFLLTQHMIMRLWLEFPISPWLRS